MITNTVTDGLLKFLAFIVTWITQLFGYLINWFADLLTWVFQIQTFTRVPAVQAGWTIARDLANMFFILILLVIGFATILRAESYGIKKLLPRLIIIALLVNFSLLAAGVVIDVGNDLGLFFVTGGNTDTDFDLGENIIAATKVQKTAATNVGLEAKVKENITDGGLYVLINAVMRLIFELVVAFLFIAMAILMVFRMVILWLLLIILPLALVFSIVPFGYATWKKWSTNFLKWAFFPAIFGFFIYIGLLVGFQFKGGEIASAFGGAPGLSDSSGVSAILGYNLIELLQYLVVVFILFYGLVVSQQLGLAGAQGAMKIATNARAKVAGWAKKGGIWTAKQPVRGAKFAGKAAVRAIPESTRAGIRERLEKMPGIGRMMGGPGARYKAQQERVKKYREDFKNLRSQDLEAIVRQKVATVEGQSRRAAAIAELAKKGGLKSEHRGYLKSALDSGVKSSDILGTNPTWLFDQAIQQTLSTHSSTKEDWAKIVAITNRRKRDEAIMKLYVEKIMPTKPDEFANINKGQIDVSQEALDKIPAAQRGEERLRRDFVRRMIIDEFKKLNYHQKPGRLHSNHLTALANKNPGLYEELTPELEAISQTQRGVLQKGVEKHIENGPGFAGVSTTP